MARMHDVHRMVEQMLVEKPYTRESDIDLYIEICEACNPNVTTDYSFQYVMKNREILGLPNYESVGRCRRKLQEHNKLLRPSKKCEDARYEQFKEYLDYVKVQS